MDTITFYSVRAKRKVNIPVEEVTGKLFERETSQGLQTRYALQADVDGARLTKFVSRTEYESFMPASKTEPRGEFSLDPVRVEQAARRARGLRALAAEQRRQADIHAAQAERLETSWGLEPQQLLSERKEEPI